MLRHHFKELNALAPFCGIVIASFQCMSIRLFAVVNVNGLLCHKLANILNYLGKTLGAFTVTLVLSSKRCT